MIVGESTIALFIAASLAVQDSVPPADREVLPDEDFFLEDLEESSAAEEFWDSLDWLREHPFDLNRISLEQLNSLPAVTEDEAKAVIAFRKEMGEFRRVDQLVTMKGGSIHLYRAVGPYVVVKRRSAPGSTRSSVAVRARVTQSTPNGEPAIGSSARAYSRLIVGGKGAWEGGGLFSKDPGERPGDGFASAYVAAHDLGPFSQFVIGDFGVNLAQGLVAWHGTVFSDGALEIAGMRGNAQPIVPYRSANEFRRMRGVALAGELPIGRWRTKGCVFWSRNSLAAALSPEGHVLGFYGTGVFNTQTLVARRNAVVERTLGWHAAIGFEEMAWVGLTTMRSSFGRVVQPEDHTRFSGQILDVRGIDFSFRRGPLTVSAERASTGNGAKAFDVETTMRVSDFGTFLLVVRSYDPDFDNLYASGFGDNGDTRNEKGTWCGFEGSPFPWVRLRCWYDQFFHPWPTALMPVPAHGSNVTVNVEADAAMRTTIALRFSCRSVDDVTVSADELGRRSRDIVVEQQNKYSCAVTFSPGSRISIASRIAYTVVSGGSAGRRTGFLAFQGMRILPFPWLSVDARLIVFEAGTYDARMYELEHELPGVFSSPALYGTGRRWYVLLGVSPFRWLTITGKIASTEKGPFIDQNLPFREQPRQQYETSSLQVDVRIP